MKFNPISEELNQFILGSILGDSHIRLSANSKKARLEFSHCEEQREYIVWKYDFLKKYDLVNSYPSDIMNGEGKKYISIRFTSSYENFLKDYRYMFFKHGEKQITRKILNKLTPLGLAIWYMDDGGLAFHYYIKKDGTKDIKHRHMIINTQAFSYKEQQIIKKYFKVVWDIDVNINKNKNSHRIVMGARSANKFIEIIKDYIHPSMNYKIDLKYKKK